MVGVIVYLLVWLVVLILATVLHHIINMPSWYLENILLFRSAYMGCLGGIMYCLRAVYLNKCVKGNWDITWHTWYRLRPITSTISGFVSYIFLKAGLLILDASTQQNNMIYGYLAIAFIAGYNVDNFMKKLEAMAESAWGINKSSASSTIINTKEKNKE